MSSKISSFYEGKTILVTGGTGSFGRRFVQTILKTCHPKWVIVFSRDELKQHDMRREIQDPRLKFFIGDIRDKERLYRAFKAEVDIVVHAAALKQVPACEYNPFEAIQTNVIGAKNIIDAAIDCGISRVMALSTDKAVSPINLYGATKLCMEKIFTHGNSYSGPRDTRFACVRYGNVVGSRGSVIPIFLEQRETGTLTVTDKRMTRFWLTLDQGVRFVLSCIPLITGGEVFVPKISSMAVLDLAEAIGPDCEITTSGIRPGEKLHESLISEDEARNAVRVDKMFVIQPHDHKWVGPGSPQAEKLPDGFSYRSDNNDQWLTKETLAQLSQTAHPAYADE
ncbi:MAG: UDP-N-acetylglucosamine 4,6-dehydratase (inverting) [Myxococcota bacterium]|nr:UDP-N-acetylglucosamine 4,6-dehydratase (inverting) [Myxococcota bacterium]